MISLIQLLLPSIPTVLVGTVVTFLVIQSIYRLFWHPLASFPGPKLAAVTKWYEFYFDIVKGHGGLFAWEIQRMHKKYGPIIRINPHELHVEDPDWFEILYASNPTRRDKYGPAANMAGAPLGTFGTVEHDIHRKRRAANSHLLSTKSIAGAEPLIQEGVQTLSDMLRNCFHSGETVELRLRFLAFTTDTITRHALGESNNLQSNLVNAQQWSRTIRAVAKVTPFVKQFPWIITLVLELPIGVVRFLLPDLARLLDFHRDMRFHAQRYVSGLENKEKHTVEPALFQHISESALPPQEKSVKRLAHEAVVVIAAGSETTSKFLTLTMFHTLSHEHVLQRLLEEITRVMPDASMLPSSKDLGTSTYLVAVVRESLRISALITSRMPLVAPNELLYNDWIVSPKTPIGMTTRDILLDPNVFVDPLKFDPDRWLTENPPPERYFVPFGKGTRMCQGVKFAYSEVYMVLTTLLRRFEFQLYDTTKERDIDLVRDCFIGEPHPDSIGVRVKVVGLRR